MRSWDKEQDRFCQIMKLTSYEYFFQAKKIVQVVLRQQPYLPQSFVSAIQKNFSVIKNLLIMLYIYSHDIKLTVGWYEDRYVTKFKEVGPNHYSQLIEWVQNQQKMEQQLAIQFIMKQLPIFFSNKLNGNIASMDLQFLLYIFNNMDIKSSRCAKISLSFISKLQQFNFQELGRDDSKENLIIKTVINILANSKKGKGNMIIILDQYLLGHQENKSIQKFCLMEGSFINSFQITVVLKIFKELFQRGINSYSISLINKISHLYFHGQEFFKLKRIYAQFILPILAKGKYCLKERVEQSVLKLCEFYIIGFSEHCRLGITGAYYLLYGIENVPSEKYRRRWARICFFAMKHQANELLAVEKSLRAKGFEEDFIRQCKQINMSVDRSVWQITTRNIREHKTYKMFPSKLKGIKNKRVQCYIISVVQALYHTKKLFPILSKCKQNSQCISSLASVFRSLQRGQDNIKVNELQRNGPQFAKNQHQQDAQQYLLALLNELEQNFKKTNLLLELKRSFQFSSRILIKCNQCKYENSSNQTGYIFTICYKDPIKFSSSENLNDFTCQYCKKRNATRLTTLSVNCQIFIVHINRFSNKWGEMKKQLPTQKIVRNLQNYELVGIIFHIGRSVESGHYVYYSRRQKKRWAELNDDRTSEFTLDDECEQFQRQFKAEFTPYILFYQKV